MNFSIVFLLGVCIGISGCSASTPSPNAGEETAKGAPCAGAVNGKRYALCGKLASVGVNLTTVDGRRVAGTLDGDGTTSGKRYSVHGGSFNVEH